jgi:uncharacterized protein (TIGR03084 family)
MVDVRPVLDDLTAEGAELDDLVSTLDESGFAAETPAPGWTIAHQIAHLAWTDRVAILAATDADGFARVLDEAMKDPAGFVDEGARKGAEVPVPELLATWRGGRTELVDALTAVPEGAKLPWFGPPMGVVSMATARLMETWAHAQDVADTLAVRRTPTARLRHVAHIGVRTVGFAFTVHGKPVPPTPFRVELTGPGGERWEWGPAGAEDTIRGPALDFCLLVTQRRHPDDLALEVTGEHAREWVPIAQAFAGLPGGGRKAGQFA